MFPNINSERGVEAVHPLLDPRYLKNPSTKCIMEGREICLLNNNSRFAKIPLPQTNCTVNGAPNSSSYSDIAIINLDKFINEKRATQFQYAFLLVEIMMSVCFYGEEILKN